MYLDMYEPEGFDYNDRLNTYIRSIHIKYIQIGQRLGSYADRQSTKSRNKMLPDIPICYGAYNTT